MFQVFVFFFPHPVHEIVPKFPASQSRIAALSRMYEIHTPEANTHFVVPCLHIYISYSSKDAVWALHQWGRKKAKQTKQGDFTATEPLATA